MDDLICPRCEVPLAEARSRGTVTWACPSCHGRAIGIAVLRRTADRGWVNGLWSSVVSAPTGTEARCPSCRRGMVGADASGLAVDVCRSCQMVWFDPGEADRAPLLPVRGTRTLPQEALERIARTEAQAIAAEYNRRYAEQMTVDEALPLVPGFAGLPLEAEQRKLDRYPIATWIVVAILFATGLWSLAAPEAADRYGLVATEIDRLGGATFLTAILVHSSAFQLGTNLYFLLIFGDNVEDRLGPATFLLLLVTGGLVGNGMHAILDAGQAETLMGAGGAVSAVTIFYAFSYPTAELRYLRLAQWHTMPASAGLLLWFLTKLVSTHEIFGRTEPSIWPYVGGAAVGLVFWMLLRDPRR